MEDDDYNGDKGHLRPSPLRTMPSYKSTLSGRSTPRSTPRGSPTFQRIHSVRTPRGGRGGSSGSLLNQCIRSNRIVYWLLLITLWAYGGFYFQSRWAHNDERDNNFIDKFGQRLDDVEGVESEQNNRRTLVADEKLVVDSGNESNRTSLVTVTRLSGNVDPALATKGESTSSRRSLPSKKRRRRFARSKLKSREPNLTEETVVPVREAELEEERISKQNSTYGLLVGPFGSIEDTVLEWSPEKRTATCDRQEMFAKLVWSRNFVLIFHELSMTGAPISMLELATELLSCGATVHAVVLSKKGGLMSELTRRKIKVIDDKADHSFKVAMKADLVIAGSAVCAQWIEKYLAKYAAGGNQIAWWIMENRREYFNRSKSVLNRVKMLMFLSELQSKQWLAWCEEEKIKLTSQISLVPLSVNDELAFVAGLPSTLNTPLVNPERMLEKKQMLRKAVRHEMGLNETDVLVISLSSISAAKGQLLLLESAHMIINEHNSSRADPLIQSWLKTAPDTPSKLARRAKLRGMLQKVKPKGGNMMSRSSAHQQASVKKLDSVGSNQEDVQGGWNLKILIGSFGSKSNKGMSVKEMIEFISENPNLSKSVYWTPTTTRVASLYSAADVYVINSQGLGETYGRVTIEAMAFGLPVLGTDAGGTKEIVDQNITGLLHPIGRAGNSKLAENIKYLLNNPSARKQMGMRGREKVERLHLKKHMYKLFFEVLFKCLRIK